MADKSGGPYVPPPGLEEDDEPRAPVVPVTIPVRLLDGAPRDIQFMVAVQDLLNHSYFSDVSRRRRFLVLEYLAEREEANAR